ncbi:MAG: MFS transporter [Alphaproteobacteria bacterium]|nr:MFS transporter [Alphaproteobacteria bacterium]
MAEAQVLRLKKDAKVVGVVSGGHFMSHYYTMMLPPLFPLLHDDLGVSYTLLGLLLSLKSIASGFTQLPAGILVDRFGARKILVFGFSMIMLSYFAIAMTDQFWLIALFFMIAGTGNAVFHPADYSIMSTTVSSSRMGRSFSAHTFAGHMGTALAPVVSLFLVATLGWSWRGAVLASVVVGLVMVLGIVSQWNHIQEGPFKYKRDKKGEAAAEGQAEQSTWQSILEILASKPMLFLFLFFSMQSLGTGGFKNFAVAGLTELHGTSLEAAGGALTGFLFASAFGVLVGGVLADYDRRHALTASVALFITALISLLVGSVDLHYALLVFFFTLAGLVQGVIRPARDMMIRAASPKGSIGKAFGFVFSGQAIGGGISPVVFGAMLDFGAPEWVFYASAVFLVLCILAVAGSAREARKAAAAGAT